MVLSLRDKRLAAVVIDVGVACLAGGWTALMLIGAPGQNSTFDTAMAAIPWIVLFGAQVWFLTTCGQSLGKLAMKIKIVKNDTRANGGFITNCLLRNVVSNAFGLIPICWPLYFLVDICFIFRSDQRCLHDLIAGTIVVDTRDYVPKPLELFTAAESGDVNKVLSLLNQGIDINSRTLDGGTALICAAFASHDDTALSAASYHAFLEVVRLLIDKGADRTVIDGFGKSAMDYAKEAGDTEMENILTS